MSAGLVGLLVTGSLAVCVESFEGLEPAPVNRIVEIFAQMVEHRTKAPPEVHRNGCAGRSAEVKLALFGGPTRILLLAERTTPGEPGRRSRLELDRENELGWAEALASLAAELVPLVSLEPERPVEVRVEPSPIPSEPSDGSWSRYVGWTAVALGVASAGAAVAFAVSASSAHPPPESELYEAGEYDARWSQLERDSTFAITFSASSVVSLLAGTAFLALGSTP